ncbi:Ltp family lipoprotein [Apilactobacillus kunkeei]|nr:Ltp family lipoprotein [Apilactobacillus kunkeei]
MSNLNLLLIFLSWGMNSFILYQYIKKKINRPNALDRHFFVLISGSIILFVLKELFFFLKIHSIVNVIMLIILDIAVIALMATFFVNRLHVNTQEIFGIPNPKRKFLYSVLVFFFIFAITSATIPNKWSYADSNEIVVNHKKKNENQSKKETTPKNKKEEQFTVYKVNVTKISENSSHDYLEVSGTTKASDGSRIYVSMNDKDHPDTTTNAFSNSDEEDMATVKDHKFTAYVAINHISNDSKYKLGSKLEFLISAFSGIKHDAEDDFSDNQESKLIDESTVGKYKITKAIHNQFKPLSDKKEDTYSDNDNDDSDYDSNDDDSDNSDSYNDSSSNDREDYYDSNEDVNATSEQKNAANDAIGIAESTVKSKVQVYRELISDGYAPSDAQYGVNQVDEMDWKSNALNKANKYYEEYGYSEEETLVVLTSSDGGEFTMAEAEYAVNHVY